MRPHIDPQSSVVNYIRRAHSIPDLSPLGRHIPSGLTQGPCDDPRVPGDSDTHVVFDGCFEKCNWKASP